MMTLRTPVVSVVIGEGGSGGALGIGVADRVLMLENSYYSVISPEGCAAILWKHRKHAPEAAAALKLTAKDLLELGIVDEVVPEPLGGAHQDHEAAIANFTDSRSRGNWRTFATSRSTSSWRNGTRNSATSECSPGRKRSFCGKKKGPRLLAGLGIEIS
jgi:acetyl-CoA carboxylase alpha subunit